MPARACQLPALPFHPAYLLTTKLALPAKTSVATKPHYRTLDGTITVPLPHLLVIPPLPATRWTLRARIRVWLVPPDIRAVHTLRYRATFTTTHLLAQRATGPVLVRVPRRGGPPPASFPPPPWFPKNATPAILHAAAISGSRGQTSPIFGIITYHQHLPYSEPLHSRTVPSSVLSSGVAVFFSNAYRHCLTLWHLRLAQVTLNGLTRTSTAAFAHTYLLICPTQGGQWAGGSRDGGRTGLHTSSLLSIGHTSSTAVLPAGGTHRAVRLDCADAPRGFLPGYT